MSNSEVSSVELCEIKTTNMWVDETNKVFGSVKKYNGKLFDIVRESYNNLKDDKEELDRYKVLVDIDRSTINKIIKIVTNDTIMKFRDQLPSSWGSLSVLTTFKEDDLLEVIENNRIKVHSTKQLINEIKNEYLPKKSTTTSKGPKSKEETMVVHNDVVELYPNQITIDWDKLDLNDEESDEVKGYLTRLELLGFELVPMFDHDVNNYDIEDDS